MKILVLAIGKPRLSYAAEGVEVYRKRLRHYSSVSLEYLKGSGDFSSLLAKSEGSYRIALDERGCEMSTISFSKRITQLETRPELKKLTFLIGGADGHPPELRERCDETWSLSKLTMQHELALVVLLEQLYRVFTIKRGEPYHRE